MLIQRSKIGFLKGFLICFSLLCATTTAGAQTSRVIKISRPETDSFPLITLYFDVTERDSKLVTDLLEEQVSLTEDGIEQDFLDYKILNPGIQLVTAFNISAPFGIQDISGKSRFDYLSEALVNWAVLPPPPNPDDLSIITNDGVEITHLDNRDDFITALEDYSPDLEETDQNLNVLSRAIEIASDPVNQSGMKRVVLLFTPPTTPEESTAIESLISQARDSQVKVYIILVSSPAFFTSTGAEVLQGLSAETKGYYATFSGDDPVPDFTLLFSPLRSTYLIKYQSQIVTSGNHLLDLSISSNLGESLGQKEFFLDVQPPNPILISPPRKITRKMVLSENEVGSQVDFEPKSIPLDMIIEFPDGHPRDLEEVTLRVDGEIVSRKTAPPYDLFDWDLSIYEKSSVHYITIEAVDTLGLSKQSIQTPVEILIDVPPPTISTILSDNAPAFAGLGLVLFLGIILFILVSRGSIKPTFNFGGNRFFKKKRELLNKSSRLRKNTPTNGNDIPDLSGALIQRPFRLVPISDISQQQITEPILVRDNDVILGNDPTSATIHIQHHSIAKQHARISIHSNGDHLISDEGSSAGTWINYKQISNDKPQSLKDGDIIHIGEAGFRFQIINRTEPLLITEEKTT